jgi:hypothetical protein
LRRTNSQKSRIGVHLSPFCCFRNGVVSRHSTAVQQERRDNFIARVSRGGSRRSGTLPDTFPPSFGPTLLGQRPRSALPARPSSCLARLAGTVAAMAPRPGRAAACGKVPNRTSRPFRPVTPPPPLPRPAGAGSQLKRRLPLKGVGSALERTPSRRGNEIERVSATSSGQRVLNTSRGSGVCWGPIGFV